MGAVLNQMDKVFDDLAAGMLQLVLSLVIKALKC